MGYSFRLTARVRLYAQSYRQDNTYHGLCYISRGALAGYSTMNVRRYMHQLMISLEPPSPVLQHRRSYDSVLTANSEYNCQEP